MLTRHAWGENVLFEVGEAFRLRPTRDEFLATAVGQWSVGSAYILVVSGQAV
jgi:hypothetical protein